MKSVLYSTLTIVLAVFAATLTITRHFDAETSRARNAVAKVQAGTGAGPSPDELAAHLNAITSQLATLNGRMLRLEAQLNDRQSSTPSRADQTPDLSALSANIRNMQASLARYDSVPPYLARLTTFLDQSFEHVERTVRESSQADALNASLAKVSLKVDAIDGYISPLYSFLGIAYDPASQDSGEGGPSLNERFDAMFLELDALRADVSGIREHLDRHFAPPRR